MLHKTIVSALLLVAFSCSPTIKNFEKYQKDLISKTGFMPSEETIKGGLPKVVVFPFNENANVVASNAKLNNAMANYVESILGESKLAEIVDRKAAVQLKEEIALAEINKSGSYQGPIIADYAISGDIANANYNSKFSEGGTYYNQKTGTAVTYPPRYRYKAEVAGNLKIYELPALNVTKAIEFSGNQARSEDVRENGSVYVGAFALGGNKVDPAVRDDGLVSKAGQDALDNIRSDIQNFFAKQGFILEKRSFKNKAIFKVSIGSIDGIKTGDNFEVFGQFESQNPLTGKNEVEKLKLGEGKISNLVDPKTAWVIIDGDIKKIRIGDFIKLKYKKSIMKKVGKDAMKLLQ